MDGMLAITATTASMPALKANQDFFLGFFLCILLFCESGINILFFLICTGFSRTFLTNEKVKIIWNLLQSRYADSFRQVCAFFYV